MNKIGPDIVRRCLLSKVREAVDALLELAEKKSECSALLFLVKNTIIEEFQKAEAKIADEINRVVELYYNRECIIAGLSPEVKASRDENGKMDIGESVWMDIKKIGIRRVGETTVYQLTIDDENVPCSGIPDELAIRLFRAIDAFRATRNDKMAAHE